MSFKKFLFIGGSLDGQRITASKYWKQEDRNYYRFNCASSYGPPHSTSQIYIHKDFFQQYDPTIEKET